MEIQRPNVGAGVIYFKSAFSSRPVVLGNPATKGTTLTGIPTATLASYYGATPSCSGTINSGLTSAITVQAQKEAELNGPCATNLADVANGIRNERNEYSLRIWGMRQSIGNQNDEYDKLQELDVYINDKSSIIDGQSSANCVK